MPNSRKIYRQADADATRCPVCGCTHLEITRAWANAERVTVARVCRVCGHEFRVAIS